MLNSRLYGVSELQGMIDLCGMHYWSVRVSLLSLQENHAIILQGDSLLHAMARGRMLDMVKRADDASKQASSNNSQKLVMIH